MDLKFDTNRFMLIVRLVKEKGESFLDTCGYPEDVKDTLRLLGGGVKSEDEELDLMREVTGIIRDLRATRTELRDADTQEKAMYFRTMTQNIGTLVELKNGLMKKNQFDNFVGVVVDIIERYLDKDEISEVYEKLRELGTGV